MYHERPIFFILVEYAQIIRSDTGFVSVGMFMKHYVSSTTRILLRHILVLSQFLEAVQIYDTT